MAWYFDYWFFLLLFWKMKNPFSKLIDSNAPTFWFADKLLEKKDHSFNDKELPWGQELAGDETFVIHSLGQPG